MLRTRYINILIIFLLSSCLKKEPKELLVIKNDEPKTIFIHGIILPIITNIMFDADCPIGFYPAKTRSKKYFPSNIAHELCSNSKEFELNSFYIFGWCGTLSFKRRLEAARILYLQLKRCSGPITIIAYSHGCNVALNLAKIAKKYNDQDFSINRLILLASPVQEATHDYISSPIFKKVFAFYSSADLVQIIDPQGIYPNKNKKPGIFSKRTFAPSSNLVQARILFDRQSPSHSSFISKRFLKRVGLLVSFLEEKTQNTENINNHFILNISRYSNIPEILTKESLRASYVPRVSKKKFN